MKIQPISNYAFQGVLGKSEYVRTESLYGGEYDCHYYKQAYHPFADETEQEIHDNMSKFEQEINAPELENAATSASGSYTYLYQSSRLGITKEEYENIKKRTQNL